MKFSQRLFIIFLLCVMPIPALLNWGSTQVQAAALSSALIRPGSHTVGASPLPVLVSVTTSTASIEDALRITIPTGYVYSASPSDYTVTTSLLPDGYEAWPGIGTASTVSGNQVTFPSDNLQSGITYGFYLTGGITSNPPTVSEAESVWQVETLASGAAIDDADVTVPIESSSSVSVTAAVPAASSNFSVGLTSSTSETLSQNQVAEYSLNYSTVYPTTTPITLQASWSKGVLADSSTPSVDIAEYLAGSATAAFGGAQPVIDPVSRTITWVIPSISAAAGEQSVSFSLVTTQNYKGAEAVNFTVTAAITEPAVSLPSSITKIYTYYSASGSVLPTPSPSPSPSASPSVRSSGITQVTVPSLSNTEATILVELSSPASVQLEFGTSRTQMSERLLSPQVVALHRILLPDLATGTTYYFRVRTSPAGGGSQVSDIYTITTATQAPVGIAAATSTLSFDGLPLSIAQVGNGLQSVILPENQIYDLSVRFPADVLLQSFRVTVSSDEISDVGAAYQVPFIGIGNNTYIANLQALGPYRRYVVSYDLEDYFGNRQSIIVGSIKVVKPMSVVDAVSKEPIENAVVEVERYSQSLQLYKKLDYQLFAGASFWRADHTGKVAIALPNGKYRFTFTMEAFKEKVIVVELTDQTSEYPQVELEREEGFFFLRASYYMHTLETAMSNFSEVVSGMTRSRNIFKIVAFLSMCLLSLGLVLAFSAKTHIPVYRLLSYVTHRLHSVTANGSRYIQGKVVNAASSRPVSRAELVLLDDKKVVLASGQSASNGYFHLKLPKTAFSILITEPGFLPTTYHLPAENGRKTLVFKLANQSKLAKAESKTSAILKFIVGSLFEFMLVAFCIAEIYFAQHFGFINVLPFIIISVLNLAVWTLFLSTEVLPQEYTELTATTEKLFSSDG